MTMPLRDSTRIIRVRSPQQAQQKQEVQQQHQLEVRMGLLETTAHQPTPSIDVLVSTLTSETELYRAWTMASGRKMFSCLTCTYTTSDRRTIERHKMVHTGEKPYACTDCSFRTSRRDTLNNHIRCRHPETFGLLLMAQQQQQDIGNNDYVELIRSVHRQYCPSDVTIAPLDASSSAISNASLESNAAGSDVVNPSTIGRTVHRLQDDSVIQIVHDHVIALNSRASSLKEEAQKCNPVTNVADETGLANVHNQHTAQMFKAEKD